MTRLIAALLAVAATAALADARPPARRTIRPLVVAVFPNPVPSQGGPKSSCPQCPPAVKVAPKSTPKASCPDCCPDGKCPAVAPKAFPPKLTSKAACPCGCPCEAGKACTCAGACKCPACPGRVAKPAAPACKDGKCPVAPPVRKN